MLLIVFCFTFTDLTFAGIIESKTKWTKNAVRVCWANIEERTRVFLPSFQQSVFSSEVLHSIRSDLTQEQKDIVKRAVEAEYTSARTGIHFTGWKEFEADAPCDALIFGTVTSILGTEGDTTLGFKGEVKEGHYATESGAQGKPFVFLRLDYQQSETHLKTLALHEFGHLAGLRHETYTAALPPGAPELPDCMSEELGLSKTIVTPYDSSSIMNVCGIFANVTSAGRVKLSDSDVKALRSVYP